MNITTSRSGECGKVNNVINVQGGGQGERGPQGNTLLLPEPNINQGFSIYTQVLLVLLVPGVPLGLVVGVCPTHDGGGPHVPVEVLSWSIGELQWEVLTMKLEVQIFSVFEDVGG